MLEVVANALRSPLRKFIGDGFYQNRNGEWGYYLTIWHAGHYHMISVSQILDVPSPRSIASAIESPTRDIAESGNYINRKRALGYWATVKSGAHWYMISVSDLLQPFHKQWGADRILNMRFHS